MQKSNMALNEICMSQDMVFYAFLDVLYILLAHLYFLKTLSEMKAKISLVLRLCELSKKIM